MPRQNWLNDSNRPVYQNSSNDLLLIIITTIVFHLFESTMLAMVHLTISNYSFDCFFLLVKKGALVRVETWFTHLKMSN